MAATAEKGGAVADRQRVYGLHTVRQVLIHHPERALAGWVQEGEKSARIDEILDLARCHGISIQITGRKSLDRLADNPRHQGVVIETKPLPTYRERDLESLLQNCAGPPLALALDGVQDPQNLGACLRAADGSGVDMVIVPGHRGSPVTATARKVASGGAETIPIVTEGNLANLLRRLKALGLWIAGLDADAAESLFDADLSGPLCLVLGAEDQGLRDLTAKLCDRRLRIPMSGRVESLNVAVSAGICLFEARRQRLIAKP
jgi:23S rRNA (guanosine2251-2'-O)-methyltransferase